MKANVQKTSVCFSMATISLPLPDGADLFGSHQWTSLPSGDRLGLASKRLEGGSRRKGTRVFTP